MRSRANALALLVVLASVVGAVWVYTSRSNGEQDDRVPAAKAAPSATTETTTTVTTTMAPINFVDSVCDGHASISDVGGIDAPELNEVSGIVASSKNPGVWWVHNDSGDTARIFAIDESGRLLATVNIAGADAIDWEDIASDGDTIYIADTGDNRRTRKSVSIYAIDTPSIPSVNDGKDVGPAPTLEATARRMVLTYPDGPHDAEALAFDPVSEDLFIITKDWSLKGVSGIYRTDTSGNGELAKVGELSLPVGSLVTGADISPDGSVVAVRSYTSVDLFPRAAGVDIATALESVPCQAPLPSEIQGEAIGFSADGASYMTVAEGRAPTLHRTHG